MPLCSPLLRTVADTDGWRNSTSPLSNVQTTWKLRHWDVPNGCVSTAFCSVRHKSGQLVCRGGKNYNELKALVAPLSSAPSVISELKNGSAWYVPGGKSTSARIYADAGANYVFADDEHSGSVPLAFETVFDKGQNADFWLIKYNQAIDKTYKELEQDYAPYTGFRAFKERNIYGCNTGKVDFYEDSPFHPDRLLKDLIKIFHPTLLEGYELKYFTKLAE